MLNKIVENKIQLLFISLIFGALFFTVSCNKECDNIADNKYPYLKVINENDDNNVITSVKLVDYTFENLSINVGESQTFTLDKGMPGGYDNINVNVSHKYGGVTRFQNIKVNFHNGDTTTIILKGCISYEGCQGFYLEYKP